VTLIAMNVTPVVVIRVPFGGDNHGARPASRPARHGRLAPRLLRIQLDA
jgi:hypothetical protein